MAKISNYKLTSVIRHNPSYGRLQRQVLQSLIDTPGIGPYQLDNAIKHWETAKRMNEYDRLEYMTKYHNAMGIKIMNVSTNEISFKNYRDDSNLGNRGNIITKDAKLKLEQLGIELKGSFVVNDMEYYNKMSLEVRQGLKDVEVSTSIDTDEIHLNPPTWWWEIMIREKLSTLYQEQLRLKRYRKSQKVKKMLSKKGPIKTTQTKVLTKKVSKATQDVNKKSYSVNVDRKKIKQMSYTSRKGKDNINRNNKKPKKER